MIRTGPDWAGMRTEFGRAFARYWPLILLMIGLDLAMAAAGVALLGDTQEQEAGLVGYLGYLKRQGLEFVPGTLINVLGLAIILNGLSDAPVGRAAILGRALRAMPAALMVSALLLAPYLAGVLMTYADQTVTGWWLGYAAGVIGAVGLSVIIGFGTQEAIARGLDPLAALRASASLTFSHRAWLAWVLLGVEGVMEALRWLSDPFDGLLVGLGFTVLGQFPGMNLAWSLGNLIIVPLNAVLYFELRRLQSEDASWLGAIFD